MSVKQVYEITFQVKSSNDFINIRWYIHFYISSRKNWIPILIVIALLHLDISVGNISKTKYITRVLKELKFSILRFKHFNIVMLLGKKKDNFNIH